MTETAFYCVADERYFLGAVGLVNSLRLAGHAETIYVLDCGLTPAQRDRLESQAVLVPGPRGAPPWLLKTIAPLEHPAEIRVLIDVDMVVTCGFGPLLEEARKGSVVAFCNDTDRFVPEWGELLELGPLERRPYVSSGLVVLGGDEGAEVLDLLDHRQRRVDIEQGFYGRRVEGYPFLFPEQDVLNAILCARPDPARTVRLPNRLAAVPPYRGVRTIDLDAMRCAYPDGVEPYVLHQFVRKPWLDRIHHGIYSRFLVRALLGEDVAIGVDETELPLRMRRGLAGAAARLPISVVDLGRWYATEVFPDWVRARLSPQREAR
jgi:hypothetical protein